MSYCVHCNKPYTSTAHLCEMGATSISGPNVLTVTAPPDDGGPAFPLRAKLSGDCWAYNEGMSLRDYIAIHANDEDLRYVRESGWEGTRLELRYRYADKMLKARKGKR